jgi:hypothetical protein
MSGTQPSEDLSPLIWALCTGRKCARERRDALAQTEKRLHKCADNAKLIVGLAAQNELP